MCVLGEVMWDAILDAILDALKIFPILLLCYVLIELLELKTAKSLQHSRFLKGKFAPLFGAGVGIVPQCGFSVIATDLYTKKSLSLGTLFAIYIATSDEAIPIMLSYPSTAKKLWIVLLIKFGLALLVGYVVELICLLAKPKQDYVEKIDYIKDTQNTKVKIENAECDHDYFVAEIHDEHHTGCCGHDIEDDDTKFNFWHFIKHPLLHSVRIFGFVLAINIIIGLVVFFITEDRLISFLNTTIWLQPLLAGLVGLIPNCASSVVISKFYAMGGLTLGACISGLSANAGLGVMMLLKQNKNRKQTYLIILSLYLISVVAGYIITLF